MSITEDLRARWQDHVGLVAGSLAFALVALNVLFMANFDPLTARAIMSSGGAVDIALASLVASIPGVVVLLFGLGIGVLIGHLGGERRLPRAGWWVALLPLSVFFIVYIPFALMGFFVLFGVAIWFLSGRKRRPRTSPKQGSENANTWANWLIVGCLAGSVLMTFLSNPYLPTESIAAEGEEPFTGFVIGERDTELIVLGQSADHAGITAYDRSVVTREICRDETPWYSATPLTALRPDDYRECPD